MATTVKKNPVAADGNGGNMTLTGHLKELRNRLFVVVGVFVVVVTIALANAEKGVNLLLDMSTQTTTPYTFVTISPSEMLLQYFRISLIAGAIVAIPLALFEIWAFSNPGLKRSESLFFGMALLFGLALFVIGVLFAYEITLPFMLNFLITVGVGQVSYTPTISVAEYINFVMTIFIIFGCVFEMPLLSIILAKLGIASPELMKKGRGVAIVLCFLVAAIITPPDIFSQIMVAIPMVLLYQVSIWLAGIFYKPKAKDDDEDDEDDDTDEDDAKE
ncbi:MAG: twin-arginine translocase subunit TatC [Faecalibacterium sp.]|jgi:sec-independent protein translocase protein TatC|nr:twin-arginine translocase subunit TatC [Faecalibacterium sp.]